MVKKNTIKYLGITSEAREVKGMKIWGCSYCDKDYQTKAKAKQHERIKHGVM